MKPLTIITSMCLAIFTATFLIESSTFAETPTQPNLTKSSMQGIYQSYKELQLYLLSSNKFFATANQPKISSLVSSLNAGFHSLDNIDPKFRDLPGFGTNVEMVKDTLDQVSKDLKTGATDYDFLRLKAISRNCLTCHTAYRPDIKFEDSIPSDLEKNPKAKAEFLAATRQYIPAEKAFFEAALSAPRDSQALNILRQWLVIQTRIYDSPKDAISKLEQLKTQNSNLRPYEQEEINDWIKGLTRWSKDTIKLPAVDKVKLLLRETLNSPEPAYAQTPEIELLRGSGILHRGFGANAIPAKSRGEALYLLGLIYSKLPLFFIDELPEMYLEESIRENPNTTIAKSAYDLYKEIVTLGYTGSSGTHVPGEALSKIDDLYKAAYGIPNIQDRM